MCSDARQDNPANICQSGVLYQLSSEQQKGDYIHPLCTNTHRVYKQSRREGGVLLLGWRKKIEMKRAKKRLEGTVWRETGAGMFL